MGTQAPPCLACGQVPAHHRSLWLSSTGDVFTLRFPFSALPFARWFLRLGDLVAAVLGRIAFSIARVLRIIRLSDDVELSSSTRSKLLWREANRRGLQLKQLLFFGNATDTFRIRTKRGSYFFKSLPLPPPGDSLRMDDKVLFKQALHEAGLPAPQSRSVRTMKDALAALTAFGTVCVKPQTGSNGRHTYPHVRTEDELREALKSVKEICAFASVEEHLEGNLCRATCVGNALIGFLESRYPTVVGDGASTITELVAGVNASRPQGVEAIVLSEHHLGYIGRRGFTADSVLPAGTSLPLTFRAGAGCGGSNREYGRAIHPSFIAPIERAAQVTGLSIVGFDLIIPDPCKPADEQRWGFVEANSLPWIDLHATPFYGDPIDLSPHVWDLWEARHGGTR